MPYKLIKNQFGGAGDICQILILIAVVVVVYYLFVQSQPAVNSVEKYSAHSDIAVSEQAFTPDEEDNRKNRPAVDITYTGVPYYHIPSKLTSENTYATPEETEKNESNSRAAVAKTYKRERETDMQDEVMGRQKMDHDFGIVVNKPRVYRTFKPSSVAYSPPFDTTTVQSIVTSNAPESSTSGRSYSSSSASESVSSASSASSPASSSASGGSSTTSASYTISPPSYVSTAPSSGKPPRGITLDRSSTIGTVSSTPVSSSKKVEKFNQTSTSNPVQSSSSKKHHQQSQSSTAAKSTPVSTSAKSTPVSTTAKSTPVSTSAKSTSSSKKHHKKSKKHGKKSESSTPVSTSAKSTSSSKKHTKKSKKSKKSNSVTPVVSTSVASTQAKTPKKHYKQSRLSTSVASSSVASKPVASTSVASSSVASKPVASTSVASSSVASTLAASSSVASKPVLSTPVLSSSVKSTPILSTPIASVASTSAASTPAASTTVASTPVTSSKKVVEKFTDVNKLYSAQDGYDLKTPLSKSLCSQKCCGYYWKENMGDLFKKNDTVGWEDVGVGKKYRTSNVTCMGDGVAPPGCRC